MTIVIVSILIFVLTLGAALAGLHVNKWLPEEHNNEDARRVVGQMAGLVSLLLAIVLGTLVGTSFAFFGAQKTELEALSAQILEFDKALAQYGPETKPARDRLKQAVQHAYDAFWGGGEVDPRILTVADALEEWEATKAFLANLNPASEAQKQALASANTLANQIEHGRVLISLQIAGPPVNLGLVIVLLIWTVILFFATSLFVQTNPLVVAALTFGAICVAFAIFLILDLGRPYTGMFRISPAALQEAMANIDK
jgi:hypothetical protein